MTPEELKEELKNNGFDIKTVIYQVPGKISRSFYAVKQLSDMPGNEMNLVICCKVIEDRDYIQFVTIRLCYGFDIDTSPVMVRILDLNEKQDRITSDWKIAVKDIVEKKLGLLEKTYARLIEFNLTGI